MKSTFWNRAGRLWIVGLLLFALRLAQNRTGFDPVTGLSLPSVPGTVLVVCLAFAAVMDLVLTRRQSGAQTCFAEHFAAPGRSTTALVLGCMLLAAGGILLALDAIMGPGGIAPLVTGVLALATAGGLLVMTRRMRGDEAPAVASLLPSMFFGVFWVLSIYLPRSSDPVLSRFYLQVLAAALVSYAFSQLAGFLRGESRPRIFTPVADLAVMLCIAAMADGGRAMVLLYGGSALVLTVFLLLQQEEDVSR